MCEICTQLPKKFAKLLEILDLTKKKSVKICKNYKYKVGKFSEH